MDNNVEKIELFKYKISFLYPLTTNGSYSRTGIVIFLYDKNGYYGIGEISPMPYLSKETIYASLKQLMDISELLQAREDFANLLESLDLFPSVKFGLELAFLDLMANRKGVPLWKIMNNFKPKDFIKINALVTNLSKSKEICKLIKMGYTSFKFKVKNMEDIEKIKKIRSLIGNDISIRVDTNKSFSFKEGIILGKTLYPYNIDYIEDPIFDINKLKEFFYITKIHVGIDQDINNKKLRYGDHVKAWIIKPGIIGGLKESISLINEALANNIYPIVSNPFYSGIAVSCLVQMASAFVHMDIPMGFDPYRWIEEDILEEPFDIINGSFSLKDVVRKSKKINKKKLTIIRCGCF